MVLFEKPPSKPPIKKRANPKSSQNQRKADKRDQINLRSLEIVWVAKNKKDFGGWFGVGEDVMWKW